MKRIAFFLIGTLPLAAGASELSYSYVELGHSRTPDLIQSGYFTPLGSSTAWIETVSEDATGFAFNGSMELSSRFHAFAGYRSVDAGDRAMGGLGVDLDEWTLGLGFRHSISDAVDLVTRVGVGDGEIEDSSATFDLTRYFAEVGVRGKLAPRFEGYLYAGYVRFDGGGGDTYGRIGGQFNLNQSWGLIADVKFGDGVEQYFLGPRLSF